MRTITAKLTLSAVVFTALAAAAGGAGLLGLVGTGAEIENMSQASAALADINAAEAAIQSLFVTGRDADADAALAGIDTVAASNAARSNAAVGAALQGMRGAVASLHQSWNGIAAAGTDIDAAFDALGANAAGVEARARESLGEASDALSDLNDQLENIRFVLVGLGDVRQRATGAIAAFERCLRTGDPAALAAGQDLLSTASRMAADNAARNTDDSLNEPLRDIAGRTAALYRALARDSSGAQTVDLAARWPTLSADLKAIGDSLDKVYADFKKRQDRLFGQTAGFSIREGNSARTVERARAFSARTTHLLMTTLRYRLAPSGERAEAIDAAMAETDKALKAMNAQNAAAADAHVARYRDAVGHLVAATAALQRARADARAQSAAAAAAIRTATKAAAGAARAEGERNMIIVGAAVLAIILAAAGATLLMRGQIIRPISRLTSAMRRLADGDLDVEIPRHSGRDEIGEMVEALCVFQANAGEREALSRRTEAEQAARDRRHARMDRAIADFGAAVGTLIANVNSHVARLDHSANDLTDAAGAAEGRARTAAAAAAAASGSVGSMAQASAALAATQGEAMSQADAAVAIVATGTRRAHAAGDVISGLSEAAGRIGDVIDLIGTIAAQTNLLALNATIEAARAGEAGKGFAVVAAEVKGLAAQTKQATDDIRDLIVGIGQSTGSAVELIRDIAAMMTDIDHSSAAVLNSVTLQGHASEEISASAASASNAATDMARETEELSSAVEKTHGIAAAVFSATLSVNAEVERLHGLIAAFTDEIRAA